MIDQENINTLISKNLRKIRIEKGLTLQQVGDILNVSNQQYSLLELNKNRTFSSQLAVLANYYELSVEYFYQMDE